jgi:hypothetical protein
MSVAVARVFKSALAGNSKDRPELVAVPLPLTARVAVLRCRGGEEFLRRLFEPLGYQVVAEHHPLDEKFPEWGEGPYYTVEISKDVPARELAPDDAPIQPIAQKCDLKGRLVPQHRVLCEVA